MENKIDSQTNFWETVNKDRKSHLTTIQRDASATHPADYYAHYQDKEISFRKTVENIFPEYTLKRPAIILELSLFAKICRQLDVFLYTGITPEGQVGFNSERLFYRNAHTPTPMMTDAEGRWLLFSVLSFMGFFSTLYLFFPVGTQKGIWFQHSSLFYVVNLIPSVAIGALLLFIGGAVYGLVVPTKRAGLTFIDALFLPRRYRLSYLKQKGLLSFLAEYFERRPFFKRGFRLPILRLFWPDNEGIDPSTVSEDERITLNLSTDTAACLLEYEPLLKQLSSEIKGGVFAHVTNIGLSDVAPRDKDTTISSGFYVTNGFFVALIDVFGTEHFEQKCAGNALKEIQTFTFERFIETENKRYR